MTERRLSRRYPDGNYPIPFTIFQKELHREHEVSVWNERFENPCILNIQNKNGKLYLRMLEEYREYEFAYWDGQAWCEMERQGKLLAFRADKIRFQSIAGEKGGCFQEESGFRFLMGTMRKSFCLPYILRKKSCELQQKRNYDLK